MNGFQCNIRNCERPLQRGKLAVISSVFFLLTISGYFAFAVTDISSCQDLNAAGEYYNLTQNVNSSGTCFNVMANNITLDGHGYWTNYSNASTGYGINITGRNNITIKNLNIIKENASVSNSHAIYISGTSNSTVTNTFINITGGGSSGIYLYQSPTNTVSNNTVITWGASGHGIRIESSSNSNDIQNNTVALFGSSAWGIYLYPNGPGTGSNISGGSSISRNSYDFYLRNAYTASNFINTNFTVQKSIYFFDTTSWFNYNNETTGNLWIKTNVSAQAGINRTLTNWNNTLVKWNDTNISSGATIIARYNISGLLANINYNVANTTGFGSTTQILQTDSTGNLPSFTVPLNGNTEISISQGLTLTLASPANTTYPYYNITISGSTNAVTNISYSLNGAANITVCTDCNSFNTWNSSTQEGTNNITVYAINSANPSDMTSKLVYFTVDTTPPMSATNLMNQSSGDTWILWNWTNPSDPDFNHTEVWVNGAFRANVSVNNYTATDLLTNTSYQIQTRTVDNAGNVNQTWVNSTARTSDEYGSITITGNTTWKDQTRIYAGNITITSTGNLTIDNTIIKFDAVSENYGIYVNGGNLTIRNNSFISVTNDTANSTMWTWIHIDNGGGIYVTDSTVERVNGQANPYRPVSSKRAGIALLSSANDSFFDNITMNKWIADCVYGAISIDTYANANVTNSRFNHTYNNRTGGCNDEATIYLSGLAQGKIQNNSFYNIDRAVQPVDSKNLIITYNIIYDSSTPISFFRNDNDSYVAYNEINYTDPTVVSYTSIGCNKDCNNDVFEYNVINADSIAHNGIHFNYGANNITVRYNTFRRTWNGIISGSAYAGENQSHIYVYGNVVEDLTGSCCQAAYALYANDSLVYDNIFRRATIAYDSCILTYDTSIGNTYKMKNVTFINNTLDTCYYGIVLRNTTQIDFIDNNITNSSVADIVFAENVVGVRFINNYFNASRVKWGESGGSIGTTNDSLRDYYYADILVRSSNNQSLSNISVIISNEVNSSYPPINRNGENKTSFATTSDGHTPLPLGNNSGTAVLMAYWRTPSTRQNMTYNILAYDMNNIWTNVTNTIYPNGTIQQLQPLANVSGVNPDSSWYRPNPNTYQNTTTLQINYTRTNITVNANQNATNITVNKWNTSLSAGNILINFTASSVNGNNVNFTVCNLTASTIYIINKNSTLFTTKTSSVQGCISFNNSAWSEEEFTIQADATPPAVTIALPQNTTYASINRTLNYTVTDNVAVSSCWYNYNGTNTTLSGCANATFTALNNNQSTLILYANDTSGNINSTNVMFTVNVTAVYPQYSSVVVNASQKNASALFSVYWTDDAGLTAYIFSTNNSGAWQNQTYAFTGTANWSNATVTLNDTIGTAVGYIFYANNTNGNWNNTGIRTLTVSCTESWSYSDWSACSSSIQTRTATDANSCGTTINRSALSQSCSSGTSPGGSSGGGGGGTPSTTKTITVTPNEPLTKVVVNLKTSIESPSLTVVKVTSIPVSSPTEPVYQYVNITKSKFNNTQIENATIDFKVNKSWILENNFTRIWLAHYDNGWTKLKTDLVNSTATVNYYRAYTNSFSYFAIIGEKAQSTPETQSVTPPAEEQKEEQPQETTKAETQGQPEIQEKKTPYFAYIIAAIVLIIAAYVLSIKAKEKSRDSEEPISEPVKRETPKKAIVQKAKEDNIDDIQKRMEEIKKKLNQKS